MTTTIAWHDGLPDLDGLDTDTILGPDGDDWMRRHHLTDCVPFHTLLIDDPQPDPHDHPWDYVTVLLVGGYREYTVAGIAEHRAPSVLRRHAEDPHRLELLAYPTLTLVTTGPVRRRWGFHLADGTWLHWSAYPHAWRYADSDDPDAITGCRTKRRRPPTSSRRS